MSAASLGVLALVLGSGVEILRSPPEPPTPQPRPITAQIEAPQFVSGVDLPASPRSVGAVETPVISGAPAPRFALQPADPAPRIDQTPFSLAGIREAKLMRLAAAVPPGTRVSVPSGPDWVFNIPGLRIAASILAEPEEVVRYFHPEDRALAEAAAQTINARVDDFTFYAPAPPEGTVQVWLSDAD
ncbi:hypothetical protein [Frigidibacter sp. MR17.14]|uniref:hypothetical protein n=1 Tax=Frigidibacter sp. MR17.14 TaxID=3126509 RepID=UPI003012E89B